MSPVDFKKWQCPLSLMLNVPVDFKVPHCRMSILRNGPVGLSNLRVKGPTFIIMSYLPKFQNWTEWNVNEKNSA